jgi:UDP-N-acetylmuramoyl-tripeptide--D-alanyl-D-alanine ligase
VAITPGNMNTPLGISRFVSKLTGEEDILIFELGEYYPKDIEKLCRLVKPQMGIITGINEAHLSKFKTLDRTIGTIFELADALPEDMVYKNGDSPLVRTRTSPDDPLIYTEDGVNGWVVSDIATGLEGTTFTAKRGHITVHAKSGLLGRHQVGPLVACIDIADRLGLTPHQIEQGMATTGPFEHRLQPRPLAGAWVVDDTYNGNSDGIRAGLNWLAEVPAKRRVYVTPGLVEQGSKSQMIHEAIGRHIAESADVVVLMKNSVTPYIAAGLKEAGFKGELKIVADPVQFYSNLEQFVAAGDVVLLQNDWTDNFH